MYKRKQSAIISYNFAELKNPLSHGGVVMLKVTFVLYRLCK